MAAEAQVIATAVAQVLAIERSRTAAEVSTLQRRLAALEARLDAKSAPGLLAVGE
jgi:BMFP domain-containing protein YqiC